MLVDSALQCGVTEINYTTKEHSGSQAPVLLQRDDDNLIIIFDSVDIVCCCRRYYKIKVRLGLFGFLFRSTNGPLPKFTWACFEH